MPQQSIDIRPIAGALGAEILGVDLVSKMGHDTIAAIRQALLDHLVIFFRDQELGPPHQIAFAKRFGKLVKYPMVRGLDGFPEIVPVVKLPDERINFGGLWHSDTTYLDCPPMGTILAAKELPPYGGDTIFANMYMAYETLSEGMRDMLGGMVGINSSAKARVSQTRETSAKASDAMEMIAEHPVVRTHPETGRKLLYVNYGHTVRFRDMSYAESTPLLNFLYAHQSRPEFTCCFRWRPGSVAFWDNRCTQHNPINDYHGFKRVMHRITIAGDRPI